MIDSNKYALVTGARSGIGYELAKIFAANGYNLVIIGREIQEFEAKAAEFRTTGVTDTDFFNKTNMNRSKAVQDKDVMADPADVARDGFDALMAGKDKVIAGFKNKVQVAMANLSTDSMAAHQMNEQQKPVDE